MSNARLKLASLAFIAALTAGAAEAQGRYDRYGYHPPKAASVDVQQNGRGIFRHPFPEQSAADVSQLNIRTLRGFSNSL